MQKEPAPSLPLNQSKAKEVSATPSTTPAPIEDTIARRPTAVKKVTVMDTSTMRPHTVAVDETFRNKQEEVQFSLYLFLSLFFSLFFLSLCFSL